uniref:Uncharacterized protein AlNc14C119G6631 n=1 Tax=Albugo laibachii Nc14 TaxID=890382 RepID=F0WJA2_9STRA|nr:conserved hypothetical protein [Albugo laibachii Nc14]CCA26621.1 conserved hypothetical protein [Albugo laibachii Nc14]|eukprot:CCA26621.1 conserved hypothetical protein [Albugo laibachii Nc14]
MPLLPSISSKHQSTTSTPRSTTSLTHSSHNRSSHNVVEQSTSYASSVTNAVSPAYLSVSTYNNPQVAQEQIVVGISASAEDEVEDWSNDFRLDTLTDVEQPLGDATHEPELADRFSGTDTDHGYTRQVDVHTFMNRLFPPVVMFGATRTLHREHSTPSPQTMNKDGNEQINLTKVLSLDKNKSEDFHDKSGTNIDPIDKKPESLQDDEEENWDAEIGLETCNEEGYNRYAVGNDNRSDNFNMFIKVFHDMMDGEDIGDEDDESVCVRRTKSPTSSDGKMALFQQRRNESQSESGLSVRSHEQSSHSGTRSSVEMTLSDRFRLVEIACSSAYAVRIERFPKPCSSYHHIEKELQLPCYSDAKFERWLQRIVTVKCKLFTRILDTDYRKKSTPTLEGYPLERVSMVHVSRRLMLNRYRGDNTQSQSQILAYFRHIAKWKESSRHPCVRDTVSLEEYDYIACLNMEIVQEAARVFVGSETQKWMDAFHFALGMSYSCFPEYKAVLALIEIRYVCHHLVSLISLQARYKWVICAEWMALPQIPSEQTLQTNSLQEILNHYGALYSFCTPSIQEQSESKSNLNEIGVEIGSWSGLTLDSKCIKALILCDIQDLTDGKSALTEEKIVGLSELVDLDSERTSSSEHSGLTAFRDNNEEWTTESELFALIPQDTESRRVTLLALFEQISASFTLIKAKCAVVLSSLYAANLAIGSSRTAESLAYESLCLLEVASRHQLMHSAAQDEENSSIPGLVITYFINGGILSELGRNVMETLGDLLISNQKYRYGIRCLEAACSIYAFLHRGNEYEKLTRHMCTLTLEAEDVKRAVALHEKVAKIAQVHGNVNEFVYLSQVLSGLWLLEGQFAQAETVIETALQFLREYCGMLPPYFSERVNGANPAASEATSSFLSSRSSSNAPTSQINGSLSSRSLYSGELESWLSHDVSLHLMLRDVYRSSGRFMKAVAVVEHLLGYNMRLPRGKRTNLRMLLAEDALQCRSFDQSFWILQALEQEALGFHERVCEVGLRSVGIGTEARFGYDAVTSCRYVLCRAKLHVRRSEFLAAFAWLTIARFKGVDQGLRFAAKLDYMDASIFVHLCREAQERLVMSADPQNAPSTAGNVLEIMRSFAGSMYSLSTEQVAELQARLERMSMCLQDIPHAMKQGIQAAWMALERYQTLEDRVYQIKTLLLLVQIHTDPIRLGVFACGSQYDQDTQRRYLSRTLGDREDVLEEAKASLLEAQKLLASALSLSEQVADVFLHTQALIKSAETWMLLEKVSSQNRKNRQLKEAGACWEEAVRLVKAVFFRRVSFCDADSGDSSFRMTRKKSDFSVNGVCELASTFSMVPVLNFSETFLLCLDDWLMSLIWTACVFLKTDRLPMYLDNMVAIHFDELLSARMGLGNILHQLRVYRTHQVSIWIGNASNSHNCASSSSHRASSSSIIQRSFIESPRLEEQGSPFGKVSMASPSTTSSSGSSSRAHTHRSSKVKRCSQHRKNLSMSSISELLASSVIAPSSFHDASYSYEKGPISSAMLPLASPRTGLVCFEKRGEDVGVREAHSLTNLMILDKTSESSAHSSSTNRSRVRASLLGTPNSSLNGEHAAESLKSGPRNTHKLSRGSSVGGFNDSDPTHSAKLRWVFNEWHAAKRNYISGKLDVTALRYQNLRTLRFLLDAFDAQQVAILSRWSRKKDGNEANGAGKADKRAFGSLQGFDVAHLNSHALFQYKNHVLVIGYDAIRTSYDDSQFKFKVFPVRDGDTTEWRTQIPRPEWYLTHYDNSEADAAAIGQGILRTMRLLGIKRLLKILGSLLLETPLVVVGSSFPQVKDVTLSLMKLLYPFQWPHVCIPFLPVSSWRFAYDSMHSYLMSHQRLHLRPRRSRHMRWGSSSNIMSLLHGGYSSSSTSIDRGSQCTPATPTPTPTTPRPSLMEGSAKGTEPFVFGILSETWDVCMTRFASNMDGDSGCCNTTHGSSHCRVDERAFAGAFHIVDLDRVEPISAKHSCNHAIPLPRKWRKHVLERLTRAVKYTRRIQQKTARMELRRSHGVSALDLLHFSRQSHHEHHTRSASHWVSSNIDSLGSKMALHPWQFTPNNRITKSIRNERNTLKIDSDERRYYGFECNSVLRNGVLEMHVKLLQCCDEYQKKKSRQKSKRSAAKQEIKSWFSSSHDMEAFVERFCQTQLYLQFEECSRENGYLPSEWVYESQRTIANHAQMAMHTSSRIPRWGRKCTMKQLHSMAPMNSAQSVSSSRHSYRHSGALSNPSSGRAPSTSSMNLATISI